MHAIYEKLQEKGEIGPFQIKDGRKEAKPYEEYPKIVTNKSGQRITVKSLNEEADAVGSEGEVILQDDPLSAQKRSLAAEEDRMRQAREEMERTTKDMQAKLNMLSQAGSGVVTPVQEPPAELEKEHRRELGKGLPKESAKTDEPAESKKTLGEFGAPDETAVAADAPVRIG